MQKIKFLTAAVSLCCLALMVASGCAWFPGAKNRTDKVDQGAKVRELAVIKIPEHLAEPDYEDLFPVPPQKDLTKQFHLKDKLELRPPKPMAIVLDEQKVQLKQNKKDAWLKVAAPREQVWDLLQVYWAEQNILIVDQAPNRGVMITEWFAPSAKQDESVEFKKVKLQVDKDETKNISNIRVVTLSKKTTGAAPSESMAIDWSKKASKSSKKSAKTFLTTLQDYFNDNIDKEKSVSLLAQTALIKPAVEIRKQQVGTVLLIPQEFNYAWSALDDAIKAAEFPVSDIDRTQARFYLELKAGGSKSKLLKQLERKQLLKATDDNAVLILQIIKQPKSVMVMVENKQGETVDDALAEFILQQLKDHLG